MIRERNDAPGLFPRACTAYLWLFSRDCGARNHLCCRWLFLRALGLIYFSAFFSLLFQIRGLIGPGGIFSAGEYLERVREAFPGALHLWYAPTILWLSSGNATLGALCWAGLVASLLVTANVWPRLTLAICFVCFLSFVAGAGVFSEYQSDGMLLEASFLSLFLAPRGVLPGLGARSLPSHASLLLLLFEWLRIYFESGVVKLTSGDPTWRNLTAMYEYYQNGPLPTWVGWYLQHLPNWFHIATAGLTLAMELGLVFLAVLPRPFRIACFFLVTVWQAGVIVTANYCFLNYLVLALGFLLLDDRALQRFVPARWRGSVLNAQAKLQSDGMPLNAGVAFTTVMLVWVFYATLVPFTGLFSRWPVLPSAPAVALEPFRIANGYGLFANMTPHRYEIEFQGSEDDHSWTPYPFRYKPQDPAKRPRIYAPYQPRFDWNLWFASLGSWRENPMVPRTEERLLENSHDVLGLFASNPFAQAPPRYVRAVLWQYWFSTGSEKRRNDVWWKRKQLGTYAPTLERAPNGKFAIAVPASLPEGAP